MSPFMRTFADSEVLYSAKSSKKQLPEIMVLIQYKQNGYSFVSNLQNIVSY